MIQKLYRCGKSCNEEQIEDGGGSNVYIYYKEFAVIRETAAYYIIRKNGMYGGEKRVSKKAHMPFACETKERALQCFIWRAESSIRFNQHYIRYSELAIERAKALLNKKEEQCDK